MNKQQPAERKIRVLVVENNVHLRGAYADLIRDFGYEPVVAEGQGTLLAADARHKAKQEQCHLAVVDIRLDESVGGYEIGERGLDIIQAIRPTESIVVTGYQEFRTIKRAYQREQVSEVIQKGAMMPDELCHALAALRDKQWPYVDIGPDDLMALIARQQSQPQRPVSPGEVRDLLMRVFAGEGTVQYTPITNLWKSPVTKAGMRLRSVVLWARPFGKNPCVVKIALKHRAEREKRNYDEHVRQKLGGNNYLNMEAVDFLWNLGASVYRMHGVGEKSTTFFAHYAGQTAGAIVQSLSHFFSTIWLSHYQTCQPLAHDTLFECYDNLWLSDGAEKGVLHLAADRYRTLPMPDTVKALVNNAPHPFHWLQRMSTGGEEKLLDGVGLQQCVVHGDLHGDNLLVDDNMHVWPIDYERTSHSHVLTDFVELEHDIITRLTNGDDLVAFCAFLRTLLAPSTLETVAVADEAVVSLDPQLQKSYEVVREIRRMAGDLKLLHDFREYYLGVLFNAIFVMHTLIEDQKETTERFRRVYLLASLICARLDTWEPTDH